MGFERWPGSPQALGIAVAALCLLLAAGTAHAASADYLLLRQDWAANVVDDPFCVANDSSCAYKLDYAAFTVRELVPSGADMLGLASCEGPTFDVMQIPQEVQAELSCVLSQAPAAWEAAWNGGGRCSGLNISQYFTLMAASYNLFNANGPLAAAAPAVSAPYVARDALVQTLSAAWGVQPGVACNPDDAALLYVTLCLDPAAAQSSVVLPVDCRGDAATDALGGAGCSGDLLLGQGAEPPSSCAAYFPAAVDGAYQPPPDLSQPSGGGGEVGAAAGGGGGSSEGVSPGGGVSGPPEDATTGPAEGVAPPNFAAPADLLQPASPPTPATKPGGAPAPQGAISKPSEGGTLEWGGPLPQDAALNPGAATVSNGADFLLAMAGGLGDIALTADISFSPGDFHFQSYTLPLNVSGAMRIRTADPARPAVIDWSNASGLINVYQNSSLTLQGIVSQNVGNGQKAIADRTVRVQVVGSPLWPTVTGSDGHQVLLLDSHLVVPEPQLFPQASAVLANASAPGGGGQGMVYSNLTVVTPSLVLVDLTQLPGLGVASSSYTAGKALYSLVNTTADAAAPPTPPTPPADSTSAGLSAGAIAGIAVGATAALVAALVGLVVWRRRGRAARVADPGAKAAAVGGLPVKAPGVPPSVGSSPKNSLSGKELSGSGSDPADLAQVVVRASDGSSADDAGSQRALTASRGSMGSGKPPLARQPSTGGSSDSPGTGHSVLPGGKHNPFHSNTTRDPGGAGGSEGADADDLFLSYIRTRLADVGGPDSATPPRSAPLTREGSLQPSVRRAALTSSESSLWDIPFERLHLQCKIGEGAYGRVYRGEWHATPVAVKLLVAQAQLQDTGSIAEAMAKPSPEADLMFSLRHPNCVQLMGTCLAPPCLVTEYCSRGSLADCLREARKNPEVAAALTWHRRICMALDAAKGLLYLHSYQPPIVHRDLKSPNLLVDKDWNVKVADFNLSKILGEENSSSQEVTNPRWLAPEVLQGDQGTPPSDVFGFGVVMWELLTFQIPWCQSTVPVNPWQLARMVLSGTRLPVPPQELLPGPDSLPPELFSSYTELMQRCWESNPADRPTFAAIAAQLRELQDQLECRAGC